MKNDYIPRPWLYIVLPFAGSMFLITYSLFPGNPKADIAAAMFFGLTQIAGLVGFVSDALRVWADGHTNIFEAQTRAAQFIGGLDDEARNALAHLDRTIELERHRNKWVPLIYDIPVDNWLLFWKNCGPVEVWAERAAPEGNVRNARNKIVAHLLANKLVAPAYGNKSETWINGGYEVVKGDIELYMYQFHPLAKLEE